MNGAITGQHADPPMVKVLRTLAANYVRSGAKNETPFTIHDLTPTSDLASELKPEFAEHLPLNSVAKDVRLNVRVGPRDRPAL